MSDYLPAKRGGTKDAKRLRKLREQLGLTQRELAAEFKVSPGTIALWEQEERSIPGPAVKLIELYEEKFKKD